MAPRKSKYIFGFHDPGGEHIMAEKGRRGWVLFVHALGKDPGSCRGFDYSPQANAGFATMARLNHGYEPHGTIPHSQDYQRLARCCAEWVRKSRGCHIWIIGNEMNYAVERPGVRYDRTKDPPAILDPGEVITPDKYARCYRLCRDAIRSVPGHAEDEVLVGAVAPWNAQTVYAGNPTGDWIRYFRDILVTLGPRGCDGMTLHTYTHGSDPHLVYSETKFQDPPFDKYHYDFLAYRDFMNAIPPSMRHLPVYITETDQDVTWRNENTGWVQRAYGEIDWWNNQPWHQQILALLLYRWPRGHDRWGIEGKEGVLEDFRAALNHEYVWREVSLPIMHQVEWLSHTTPARVQGDSTIDVRLGVRNDGNATWRRSGPDAVRVGFHWHMGGQPVQLGPNQDIRTPLPSDVAPGDSVSINAKLATPAEPGNLTVTWDLVEKGVTWFANVGANALTLAVEVKPAPLPSEVYFEQTGYWVRGVFLEFYRRYGLEITGYPVSAEHVDLTSSLPTQVFQRVILEELDGTARLKPAGQRLQEALQDVTQLELHAEALSELLLGAGVVPTPLIRDVTQALSRDGGDYYRREPSHVRYLIVNHSGVRKDVDLEVIAAAHRRQGWPGITYQFYVDRRGRIYRTNPDLEVVSPEEDWAAEGLNICFAGHFSHEVPGERQIENGAHLCAWLLHKYGLSVEAIVGINRFYRTQSPGTNWATGAKWRDMLLAKVQETLSSARSVGGGALVRPPVIRDAVSLLPRDADGFARRRRQDIRYLMIHQSALSAAVGIERIAETHRARGWPGTMHHYFVDAAGGVQQACRLEEMVSDGAEWLRQGVNICFAGNFARGIPTREQLDSGARLCAWLLQELDLRPGDVKGAKEFYSTQSPGRQWDEGKEWRNLLLQGIGELLESTGPTSPDVAALRAQIASLQASVLATQQQAETMVRQRDRLQTEVQQLQDRIRLLEREVDGDETQELQIRKLQAQVSTLQASLFTTQQQSEATAQQRDQLQAQIQGLQTEIELLREEAGGHDVLERQVRALQAQVVQAQQRVRELEEALQHTGPDLLAVSKPAIEDIVGDLPRHETLTYETRSLDQITHISIHHSAASANIDPWRVAKYQIKEDPSRNKDAWPGIGYHYYIGPDGTIYQTNRHETASYHSGGNNSYTVGICFAGSFMDVIPTPKQIVTGGHLVAWLMQELHVPVANVWGHKEYPNNHGTSCPGSQWLQGQKWKQMLLTQVNAVQQGLPSPFDKPIRHYVLFWWRSAELWAKGDWVSAGNYVARFHPICGFSKEEAKRAEYVLIVGGRAGVSLQAEQSIRRAGCNVERIEGASEADTRRLLDELAATDRPFSTFDISEPWWR
jgi:N-acetyl-anhydromuramyl-L-alanine amidase AmpD/predicted  nucleic acid-binding Zn-ribbon protein